MIAAEPNTAVKVLIVDDHGLFRTGLARLLESDDRVVVVGEAGDGESAIRKVATLKPDVVLMDIQMPGRDGIDVTAAILRLENAPKVLMLTTFDTDSHVLQAFESGASGYLLKDSTPATIVTGILAVASDGHVMAPTVARRVNAMLANGASPKNVYDGLTAREIEIVKLIARGMANKRIAYTLRISEKTVRNHISNVYDKLGINDRAQAVLYAVRKGLVEP